MGYSDLGSDAGTSELIRPSPLLLAQGCNRRLDPLLSYHAWVRRTVPTGISNDAMGSVPRHPFLLRVIDSLPHYHRNWYLPYITIMYSTGPLFLSVLWKEYMRDDPSEPRRVRVLMPDDYSKHPSSFFNENRGNSWHGNDAQLIFWVNRSIFFVSSSPFRPFLPSFAPTPPVLILPPTTH